jgi:hypothetical protein
VDLISDCDVKLQVGTYIRSVNQPAWGIGRVISIGVGEKCTLFFLSGGRRIFHASSSDLEVLVVQHPILELAGLVKWNSADRNLYVVELNPKIFAWERRFLEANLHWIPGRYCVYVGMTGLTPEERFRKHLRGEHAAYYVRKYALRLLPELYQHFNPLPYQVAEQMEPELARQLRAAGLAVWQN